MVSVAIAAGFHFDHDLRVILGCERIAGGFEQSVFLVDVGAVQLRQAFRQLEHSLAGALLARSGQTLRRFGDGVLKRDLSRVLR